MLTLNRKLQESINNLIGCLANGVHLRVSLETWSIYRK